MVDLPGEDIDDVGDLPLALSGGVLEPVILEMTLPIFPTIPFLLTGVVEVDEVGSDAGPGSVCTTNNGAADVAAGGFVQETPGTKLGKFWLAAFVLTLAVIAWSCSNRNPISAALALPGYFLTLLCSLLRMGDVLSNPILH